MWIPFHNESEAFMIQIKENDTKHTILYTNLKELWFEEIIQEKFLQRFQELNPTFDVKLDVAISQVLKLVNNIENSEKNIVTSEDTSVVSLHLKANIPDFDDSKFKVLYRFDLVKDTNDLFTKEFTSPMIHTVKYLEEQQKMLCGLLEKKDRELEEYKLEKGVISRSDLTTEKFDKNLANCANETLMLNVFTKSLNFWNCFKEVHGDVQVNIAEVNSDPWNHTTKKRKVYSSKTSRKKTGISYKTKKEEK